MNQKKRLINKIIKTKKELEYFENCYYNIKIKEMKEIQKNV
jgi:hypothetical protein